MSTTIITTAPTTTTTTPPLPSPPPPPLHYHHDHHHHHHPSTSTTTTTITYSQVKSILSFSPMAAGASMGISFSVQPTRSARLEPGVSDGKIRMTLTYDRHVIRWPRDVITGFMQQVSHTDYKTELLNSSTAKLYTSYTYILHFFYLV